MKIPTLLGLSLLVIIGGVGVITYLYINRQLFNSKNSLNPKNIQVVNITDTSATIMWQTDQKTTGALQFSNSPVLDKEQNDDRDKLNLQPHLIHFVTLKNLTDQTSYFYKIKANDSTYPSSNLNFKTAPKLVDEQPQLPNNQSIQGTVLDNNLQPIDEALVFLKIKDASVLAVVTTTGGNFLIPLTILRTQDFTKPFIITPKLAANLEIVKGDQKSVVNLNLPLDSPALPPMLLGQDLNLIGYQASASAYLKVGSSGIPATASTILKTPPLNKFDLNGDGKVNTIDLATLLANLGKNPKNPRADLNGDGVVDSKDFSLMKQALK